MLSRALRLGFREAIQISQDQLLARIDRTVVEIDLKKSEVKPIAIEGDYHAPLSFNHLHGLDTFEDDLVFGEYFHNPLRRPVRIFGRQASGEWKQVFKFDKGLINHIHCIIPDRQRAGTWILTGDFEHSAAIWFAKNNFRDVRCLASSDQSVRACFALPNDDGLLFCTDSPLINNSLSQLQLDEESDQWKVRTIESMPGPVIFHGNTKDGKVFSTSVEPMPNAKSIRGSLLTRKRAPGCQTVNSTAWHLTGDGRLTRIHDNPKDAMPYLFQFGMRTFPHHGERSEYIAMFNIALRGHDYCTEIWTKESQ